MSYDSIVESQITVHLVFYYLFLFNFAAARSVFGLSYLEGSQPAATGRNDKVLSIMQAFN